MEMADNRQPKRPVGWTKPYWERAGLYVVAMLISFAVSLIVVGFVFHLLLRAAIAAEPIVWRVVDVVADVAVCVGVTLYVAVREGYARHTSSLKRNVFGGLLFVLVQSPVAFVLGFAPYAAGPLTSSLSSLLYHGNAAAVLSGDAAPPLLGLVCMLAADVLVYIPAMALGDRWGMRLYQQEVAALQEDHDARQ